MLVRVVRVEVAQRGAGHLAQRALVAVDVRAQVVLEQALAGEQLGAVGAAVAGAVGGSCGLAPAVVEELGAVGEEAAAHRATDQALLKHLPLNQCFKLTRHRRAYEIHIAALKKKLLVNKS